MNAKKYFWGVSLGTLLLLIVLALPTIMVDPYFHYGAPKGTYKLHNQRYQNDGVAKYFEYDALITGSSMVENFKTTQFNQLFGVNAIKLPYSGAHFLEIDHAVHTALDSENDLRVVFRSLDLDILEKEKDSARYDSYPDYLYDTNPVNDVNYFWNKEVLFGATREAIRWQKSNRESTSFDEYGAWENGTSLTEKIEEGLCTRCSLSEETIPFTEEDRVRVTDNIKQNILQTAKDNPDVTFYLMLPPYSCLYYDSLIREGKWDYHIAVQRCAIEELLGYDNIKLFSFCNYYDVTCNLDNYRDTTHYDARISEWLLERIRANDGLLTEDNYMEYLDSIRNYYLDLDRDRYYE